jgi:predicted DNA-binding protein with PD1-like motif
MPVFTPYRSGPAGTTGCRVVLARVLPGEDLLRAASRMCAQADIRRASIRASLGSLVGPIFLEKEPTAPLPGPCAELVSLWGTVDGSRPVEPFHVIVGDATGAVHGGIIDPASSRVAVTVELLVTEESPP